MKIQEFIRMKENEAIDYEKEESAVVLLLEHVLGLETQALYLKMNDEITNEEINKFNELWNKYLNENKPIQYLIGTSCFYGYDFIVTPDVLIPRYETEELVENILYRYDEHFDKKDVDVCDLATGSGCIAIALAKEEKHMHVVATDISKEALKVAKMNNEKFNAGVTFLTGDMLEPLKGRKFDIFVSNPPYIPTQDITTLPTDVRQEPIIALDGGKDGLNFYRIISENGYKFLNRQGYLCLEIGYNQKEEVKEMNVMTLAHKLRRELGLEGAYSCQMKMAMKYAWAIKKGQTTLEELLNTTTTTEATAPTYNVANKTVEETAVTTDEEPKAETPTAQEPKKETKKVTVTTGLTIYLEKLEGGVAYFYKAANGMTAPFFKFRARNIKDMDKQFAREWMAKMLQALPNDSVVYYYGDYTSMTYLNNEAIRSLADSKNIRFEQGLYGVAPSGIA